MQNTNISFGARYIKDAQIKKLVSDGIYKPKETPIIEIDPYNREDLTALKHIVADWGNDTFAADICSDAHFVNDFDSQHPRFYAVTRQKQHFEHLSPDLVMGLAEVIKTSAKNLNLEFLQVNPLLLDFMYEPPLFKHVGTAIIDFIKGKCKKNHSISLKSVPTAEGFYEKNGFVKIDKNSANYEWKA